MHLLLTWLILGGNLLRALPATGWRACAWRGPLVLLLWLLSGLLFASHGLGFFLDECFFRRYRKVKVRAPVFILGVPRSGTTSLQRQLAQDPGFTTLSLWECVLAPSITERHLWRFIGQTLAFLGRWSGLNRLVRWCGRWRWSALDQVHRLAWQEPEEDFLLLLWRGGCFLPALLCPGADRYWRLAFFDQAVPQDERDRLLEFYHRCLQRHLFFHGQNKRLLSKNPSFTPWIQSLRARFPDARLIACTRRPCEAVPSQLSALRPVLRLWGLAEPGRELGERLVTVLHSYYRRIAEVQHLASVRILPLPELAQMDEAGWHQLYGFLEQPLQLTRGPVTVGQSSAATRTDARPGHQYRAEDFGLTRTQIRQRFASVWHEPPPSSGATV